MKTKLIAFNLATLTGLAALVLHGQGAGPLLPPGPPADGVYKTLQQVEPRIPISSFPFSITQPGSYYLTGDQTVTSGNAIHIETGNVTFDLNGFTISSTADPADGSAVLLAPNLSNILIRNGQISGNGLVSGGTFSGPGFLTGIARAGFGALSNATVSRLHIKGCANSAIDLGITSTNVSDCHVEHIGGRAIRAAQVTSSSADNLADAGIDSVTVSDCIVRAESAFGIFAASVINSNSETTSGLGITCALATNCSGSSNSGTGLRATNALNCRGSSTSGIGLEADNATNCSASTTSGATAMQIDGTATSCRARHLGGGTSIDAAIAVSCTTAGGAIVSPEKHLGTP